MKRDFNAWLQSLGAKAPVKTLTELRQWNIAHQRAGAIKYGQANLDISDEMDVQADRERYEADRRKDILLSATNGSTRRSRRTVSTRCSSRRVAAPTSARVRAIRR